MLEQGIYFIDLWKENKCRVDDWYTEKKLLEYCIETTEVNFKKFNFRNFVCFLNENFENLKKDNDLSRKLLELINYRFHSSTYKTEFGNRKYLYQGEKNYGNEIVFERLVELNKGKVTKKSISQKDIDFQIVKSIINRDKQKTDFFNSSILRIHDLPRFIIFQLFLYDFSPFRLKTWWKILKSEAVDNSRVNLYDVSLLSEFYSFFYKYEKLNNDDAKLEFWIGEVFKNQDLACLEDYIKVNNYNVFGENKINIIKKHYLKLLNEDFTIRKKQSIDEESFIKAEIKDLKDKLNKSRRLWERGSSTDYVKTYQDLIRGNRENYYYSFESSNEAGEVEAIKEFILFLEKYGKTNTVKKIVKEKQIINSEILPIEIFEDTRQYLKKNATQVNTCYKYKAYDACSVLLRKITEILIIELYEKQEIENKIKDADGNYFTLKGLIKSLIDETRFKNVFSRNVSEILPKIKRLGDLSAHNRKYNSRKLDIDKISDDFRLLFEELINTIYH